MPVPDKRVTIDDVVAEVHDGMTVGIGGWGSRRKPMALVRALLPLAGARPHARRRTAGPMSGCCAGRARCARSSTRSCRSTRSRSSRTSATRARRARCSTTELDEGMFLLGLQAAAWRVPFLPTRVGLGSDVMRLNPELAHGALAVRRRRGARRDARARRSTSRSIHMHRGDQGGTGQYLNVDPYFDDLICMAAQRRFMSVEQLVDTDDFLQGRPGAVDAHQPADDRRRGRDAARRALHRVRPRLPARRGVPEGVRRDARRATRRGTSSGPSTST